MTWFKVDDAFYDHPKSADLPDSAVALWTRAGSYCAKHLTDGVITDRRARKMCDNPDEAIKALIEAEMWEPVEDGSYHFHDWDRYQPSREEVMAERDANAARQQAWRDRKKAERDARNAAATVNVPGESRRDNPVSNGARNALRNEASNGEHNASVTASVTGAPSRPDPSRPDPSVVPKGTTTPREDQTLFPTTPTAAGAERPTRLPDSHRFDEFWDAYPHKRDKDAGRKAWTKVVRESQRPTAGFTLDEVIAAAGHYRFSKEFVGGFPKFPATFLNKGSWRDFAAGPPPEVVAALPGAARGFDAKAAGFDALRDQFRHDDAAALIRPPQHELTRGDTHA
jgi:hypothetical protein